VTPSILIFPVVATSYRTSLLIASAEDGLQKWRVVVSIMTKQNGERTRACDKLGSMVWRNNTYT